MLGRTLQPLSSALPHLGQHSSRSPASPALRFTALCTGLSSLLAPSTPPLLSACQLPQQEAGESPSWVSRQLRDAHQHNVPTRQSLPCQTRSRCALLPRPLTPAAPNGPGWAWGCTHSGQQLNRLSTLHQAQHPHTRLSIT